jgi:hypothetical protein
LLQAQNFPLQAHKRRMGARFSAEMAISREDILPIPQTAEAAPSAPVLM